MSEAHTPSHYAAELEKVTLEAQELRQSAVTGYELERAALAAAELREAALLAFEPMVLHFSSNTPRNVNMNAVTSTFTRDSTWRDRFYVVDASAAMEAAAAGQHAGGLAAKSRKASEKSPRAAATRGGAADGPTAAAHAPVEERPSISAVIRAEYERIAIEQETARRDAAAARARQLADLAEQYVDDGLEEEEAYRAAAEDLGGDEESEDDQDESDNDALLGPGGAAATGREQEDRAGWSVDAQLAQLAAAAGGPGASKRRQPLFLCIRGFPNSLDDLKDLQASGVPLDALVNVTSKVPLEGSAAVDRQDPADNSKPRSRGDARGRAGSMTPPKRGNNASGGRGGVTMTGPDDSNDASRCLVDRVSDHQARECGGKSRCCAVGEVLVHVIEFPSVAVAAPAGSKASGETFKLTAPERAVLLSIRESIATAEKRLHLFRLLTRKRRVVPVAPYTPLTDPATAGAAAARTATAAAAAIADTRGDSGKRRSPSPSRKSVGTSLDGAMTAGDPSTGGGQPLNAESATSPCTMSGVAARSVEYEAVMAPQPVCLLSESRRAPSTDAVSVQDTSAIVRRFLSACTHQVQATVERQAALRQALAAASAAEAANPASGHGDSAEGVPLPAALPLNAVLPSGDEASQLSMEREQAAARAYAVSALAPTLGTPRAKTVPCARPRQGPLPADDRPAAASGSDPRPVDPLGPTVCEFMRRLASEAFPYVPAKAIAAAVDEASCWGVCEGPVASAGPHATWERSVEGDLTSKNMRGWITAQIKSPADGASVTVLSRGDGAVRCQQSMYGFEAATTFPLFAKYIDYCAAEHGHFYPPPPPSDEDDEPSESSIEPSSSSEEEDEDGDDDEEGREEREKAGEPKKRRAKRVVTPPPPPPLVDHFRIAQRQLRRRRVYEDVKRRHAAALAAELVVAGKASRAAVEEVEWAFLLDGSTVEVERTLGNTRQVACTVTALTCPATDALEVGYMFDDTCMLPPIAPRAAAPPIGADVPIEISAAVRGFARLGRDVRLFTQVAGDNSLEADRVAYERAVAAAKAAARALYELSLVGPKGKAPRGAAGGSARDKHAAVAAPTLAELEEQAAATVPPVEPREKRPPRMTVSMLLASPSPSKGDADAAETQVVGTVDQEQGAVILDFGPGPNCCRVDLRVAAWRPGKDPADAGRAVALRLHHLRRIKFLTSGLVEVAADGARDYQVILGPRGSCATVHLPSAHVLVTAPSGAKWLYTLPPRTAGGPPAALSLVKVLEGLRCAEHSTSAWQPSRTDRTDGAYFVRDSVGVEQAGAAGTLTAVSFGPGVAVDWRDAPGGGRRCAWPLGLSEAGGPLAHVTCDPTRQWLTIRAGRHGCVVTYKHPEQAVTLARGAAESSASGHAAALDLRRYRLECHGEGGGASGEPPSWCAVDCAFGGLYGQVALAAAAGPNTPAVFRVSPLGRLSLQHLDGSQAHPAEYTCEGNPALLLQAPFLVPEVLAPPFASVVLGSGLELSAEHAVHLCAELRPLFPSLASDSLAGGDLPESDAPARTRLWVHTHRKVHGEMRDLLSSFPAAVPAHPDLGRRSLLMCRLTRPAGGVQSVTFMGHRMAAELVDCWRRLPSLAPASFEAGTRHGPVTEHVLSSDSTLVVASAGATDGPASDAAMHSRVAWWDACLKTGKEAPVVAGVSALVASVPPSTTPLSHSSPPVSGSTAAATPPRPAGAAGHAKVVTAVPAGRLHYWSSPLAGNNTDLLHAKKGGGRPATEKGDGPAASGNGVPRSSDDSPRSEADDSCAAQSAKTASQCPRGGPPLMYSRGPAAATATAAAASPRAPLAADGEFAVAPALAVLGPDGADSDLAAPLVSADFGPVSVGRRYAVEFRVQNRSFAPCRYRVVVPRALKEFVSAAYPRRFLAPGMVDTVTVTLSGWQPDAPVDTSLSITHEGTTIQVPLRWDCVAAGVIPARSDARRLVHVPPRAACLGVSLPRFVPGSTTRVRNGSSDDESDSLQASGRRVQHMDDADSSSDDDKGRPLAVAAEAQ